MTTRTLTVFSAIAASAAAIIAPTFVVARNNVREVVDRTVVNSAAEPGLARDEELKFEEVRVEYSKKLLRLERQVVEKRVELRYAVAQTDPDTSRIQALRSDLAALRTQQHALRREANAAAVQLPTAKYPWSAGAHFSVFASHGARGRGSRWTGARPQYWPPRANPSWDPWGQSGLGGNCGCGGCR